MAVVVASCAQLPRLLASPTPESPKRREWLAASAPDGTYKGAPSWRILMFVRMLRYVCRPTPTHEMPGLCDAPFATEFHVQICGLGRAPYVFDCRCLSIYPLNIMSAGTCLHMLKNCQRHRIQAGARTAGPGRRFALHLDNPFIWRNRPSPANTRGEPDGSAVNAETTLCHTMCSSSRMCNGIQGLARHKRRTVVQKAVACMLDMRRSSHRHEIELPVWIRMCNKSTTLGTQVSIITNVS